MKIYTLQQRQVVQAPVEEVFDFFSDPENLGRITPRWLGFQFLTPLPLEMRNGTVIDYAIHLLGLPRRWTTLITTFDPPHEFVDLQLRGPYAFWHHTHRFREVPGGTEMTDSVRYAMPYGPIGRIAHALVVRHQLGLIFRHRASAITEKFGCRPDLTTEEVAP